MPFYPECLDGFQDWVKVCPDCKVALVDKLQDIPRPASEIEPLVHVATAPNEPIAGMWAGILKDNGINSVLKSSDFRSAQYSLLTNQHLTIHVLESKALKTKEIISPLEYDLNDFVNTRGNYLSIRCRIFIVIFFLWSLLNWGSY